MTPPTPPPEPNPSNTPAPEPAPKAAPRKRASARAKTGDKDPVLRRTVVRPAGATPDPIDSAYVTTRMTALAHDLANLLDGSLRLMSKARRALPETAGAGHLALAGAGDAGALSKQLETVHAAMLQMSDLVRLSMAGLCMGGTAGLRASLGTAGSLADAVRHAVEVMRPLAEERGIELRAEIGAGLDEVRAGPIYAVITNGVRNAIESVERSRREYGHVVVLAKLDTGRTGAGIIIEIMDDGEGPPRLPADGSESVFRFGFSTKPGGMGIGLALSRDVIQGLGGTIHLRPRPAGDASRPEGAVLRICYPLPPVPKDKAV